MSAPAAPAPGPAAVRSPAQPDEAAEWRKWMRKLDGSAVERKKIEEKWKLLYEALRGALMCQGGDGDVVNRFAQFAAVTRPQMLSEERQVNARVTKIALGEDADAKLALAETLGDQATALARAVGLYEDAAGRSGELAKAVANSLWGMGVMLVGFEPARGRAPDSSDEQDPDPALGPIDLDYAAAQRHERSEGGMPFARSYDPRRVLFDPTYRDAAKGDWVAFEVFYTIEEAENLYGQAGAWRGTHEQVPAWSGDSDRAQEDRREGLVQCYHVYTRRECIILPAKGAGPATVLKRYPLASGSEGLPVCLLGAEWHEGELYPTPYLAQQYGSAKNENEFYQTIVASAAKAKTGVITNDPKLAATLAEGRPDGVYTAAEGANLDAILRPLEVGGVRSEHKATAELMGANWERQSGTGDLQLGRREPGNPTAREIGARQGYAGVRVEDLVRPVRMFEAAVCRKLLACAYTNLESLHGLLLPLDPGPNSELVGFDASEPLIGELLDYSLTVKTSDAMSDQEDLDAIIATLDRLPNLLQFLQMEGKTLSFATLVEQLLLKSRVPLADRILVDMAPQPQPGMEQGGMMPGQEGMMPPQPEGAAGMMAGAAMAQQPMPDIATLSAQLEQAPEGSPEEEQLLAMLAAQLQ